jgi:hypothetical protein
MLSPLSLFCNILKIIVDFSVKCAYHSIVVNDNALSGLLKGKYMNDNKLPHNWHDTTLYTPAEDKIPLSAWFGAALAFAALVLACFI